MEVNCVCGNTYDFSSIEPPEDASFYWVPKCPECGVDSTSPHNSVPSERNPYNQNSSPVGVYDAMMAKEDYRENESDAPVPFYLWTKKAIEAHREGDRLPVFFNNGPVMDRDDLSV